MNNSLRFHSIFYLVIGFLLSFSVHPFTAFSQQYNIKSYSVEDGLSQSQVYALCQDKKGRLWVGTVGGGVSVYDGLNFTNFTVKEGLPDNTITSIVEDKNGNIWMGTYGGLTRFDGETFRCYTEKDGLCSNQVYKIIEDKDGNIWAATGGAGVSRFDGKKFKSYTEKDGLAGNVVWTVMQDVKGVLWFGTDKGLSCFDGNKFTTFRKKDGLADDIVYALFQDNAQHLWIGTFKGLCQFSNNTFVNYTTKEGLVYNAVWSIAQDKSGRIWCGTTAGLSQFDKVNFVNYTTKQGLGHNTVWCILNDREGNMWFGTNGGGISKYARRCFVSYSDADGLADKIVYAIYEDRQGNTWFGTGNGLTRLNGKTYTTFHEKDGLVNKRVWSILQDREGAMWFTTFSGVSRFDGKTFKNFSIKEGLSSHNVYSVIQDKKGNLWFGTDNGVSIYNGSRFFKFTTEQGLLDKVVRSVFEDHEGHIWFATNAGVMQLVSCDPDFLHPRFLSITTKNGLVNNRVRTIAEDKKGLMWFGTSGGLNVYGLKNGKKIILDTISAKDGLSDDGIVLLKFDKKERLWIGTNKGISKLNTSIYSGSSIKILKSYSNSDGFSGVECNQNAVYEDMYGYLWFGTIKGAIRYNPQEDRINEIPPATHISGVRLFFENVDLSPFSQGLIRNNNLPYQLNLPYQKNHITFDYIGISLAVPEKVRYQYMLEGLDKSWSPVTKETHVTYSTLPPGAYVFKLKACNNDGIWNPVPVTFSFHITPPIWQRAWFIVLCIVAGLLIIFILVRLRLRSLIKQRELLEEKVAQRTQELKAEKEKVEEINLEVVAQKEIIERKNTDITDSIHYAKRIQKAILPSMALILKALPDSFVFFQPKDIVSGDFYWFAMHQNTVLIAAVDCTGHGVPGAFMSMIGNTLLNEIVVEKGILNPAHILDYLHEGVRQSLRQNLDDAETNDGMDLALCAINTEAGTLEYAAAYRPLYVVRKGILKEIKGDKFAIGGSHIIGRRVFTNNIIAFDKDDRIYLFTDGFADQFGGPEGKKFLSKRFQEVLISIQHKTMAEQGVSLKECLEEWQGQEEQIDDILVIGIKL